MEGFLGQIVKLALGLLIVGALFWAIERRWPAIRGQRTLRTEFRTDVAYWFFTPLVTRAATGVAVVVAAAVVAVLLGAQPGNGGIASFLSERETAIGRLPLWVQGIAALLLTDLISYWGHRLFHSRALLWRFHAIHHSSRELDWLSSVRLHPVNDAAMKIFQAVPLLILGFSLSVPGVVVPLLTLYALLVHANVGWTLGPFKYVIVSPAFHRWHHTSEQEGLDKNFAGLFPWMDLLFGTFYMPKGKQPERFGILGAPVPSGLIGQLAWPFRKVKAVAQA